MIFVFSVCVFCVFTLSCAPVIKTPKTGLPQPRHRGSICVNVTDETGMADEDVRVDANAFTDILAHNLSEVGYQVSFSCTPRGGDEQAVRVAVTSYRYSEPSKDTCIVTGVGCSLLSVLFSPALLLRGYYHPQAEVYGTVTGYVGGAEKKQDITERAVASAGLFSIRREQTKSMLLRTAMHNFSVSLISYLERNQ